MLETMRKFGYLLFRRESNDIIEESDYLISNNCCTIFMDPFNKEKEFPQLALMLKVAEKGDTVMVKDLSYLATTFKHLIQILELLEKGSLDLKCLEARVNTRKQNIGTLQFLARKFDHIYRQEIDSKRKLTQDENLRQGVKSKRRKGMREETYKKAVKAYRLKIEGRLSSKEIMELLNIKEGTFYKYCKWGSDGLLTSDKKTVQEF